VNGFEVAASTALAFTSGVNAPSPPNVRQSR